MPSQLSPTTSEEPAQNEVQKDKKNEIRKKEQNQSNEYKKQ